MHLGKRKKELLKGGGGRHDTNFKLHFQALSQFYLELVKGGYPIIFASNVFGGFQLLDLIIPELKSHVIPYKFKSSHWLKLQHSDLRANLVKDFFTN